MLIVYILFYQITSLYAQDSSIELGSMDSVTHKKTFIVPFEPNLYASDMDLEIGRYNQLNQQKIVEKFRISLDRALENTIQLKNETHSVLHDETSASENELIEIYSGITFVYTPVKRTTTRKDKLISTLVPPKKTPKKEAGLKNGEVYAVRDTIERYMKTVVVDSTLLQKLYEKNRSENFLFVNQLELKNSFQDVMQLQNDTYERELRVHYSILDKTGNELVGGIAKCKFANNVLNINQIISNSFPCAAKQIAASLEGYERSLVIKEK